MFQHGGAGYAVRTPGEATQRDTGPTTTDRIAQALALIEGRFGAGIAHRHRDHRPSFATEVVSSGSLALDRAIGTGGFPRGHVSELIGPESSGKTTLLYAAPANAQRAGGLVALVDAEGIADAELEGLARRLTPWPVSATVAHSSPTTVWAEPMHTASAPR